MGRSVLVGRIRRPHGRDGAVLVQPETDDPEGVYRPGRSFAVFDAPEGLPDRVTLDAAGWSPKGWRLGFRELPDRGVAQRYVGCGLELDEEELAALEPDEYFLHDLVGLEVQDADGVRVGRVEWFFDRPGQPVLVVVDDRADTAIERLVPFSSAIVSDVDLEAGILRLDPPPGLLDL